MTTRSKSISVGHFVSEIGNALVRIGDTLLREAERATKRMEKEKA